jgi:hypothetical protein
MVETYLARGDVRERRSRERRARAAAEQLTSLGTDIRCDRTIHVPEDEICFFVFEAPSSRDAALAAEQATLEAVRVVAAISSGKERREP